MMNPRLGAIEMGGTKCVCAVGTASGELLDEAFIPTRTPYETMTDVISFFRRINEPLAAIGIGSFGPIDLRRGSPTYGFITSTPKEGWRNFDVVGTVRRAFDIPVGFDTDVNAAVLGESKWGSGRDLNTLLYVTVGTGIGGGAITEGMLLHGLVHPEMGHIRVPHDWARDPFPGVCPYHGDCLEGLASGRAIEARWGVPASLIAVGHPAFSLEAEYLGLACMNWICSFSPQKVILGGGVMQPHMFPLLRDRTGFYLGGYVDALEITQRLDSYITPPGLANRAGIYGALALAASATGFA